MEAKKWFSRLVLAGASASSTVAHADDSPFDVSLYTEQGVPIVLLESVASEVVLTGFNVNRGNCKNVKLGGVYPLPLTFKFGDGVKLFAHMCSVKEVTVVTNLGTYAYSFERAAGSSAAQAQPTSARSSAGSKGQACLDARIEEAQRVGYTIRYDVMNEWRKECGLPPD